MSDGESCKCFAYYEGECGCGADWTPKEVYDLQERLALKDLEIMRLREALERLAKLGNGDRYGNSEGNDIAKQALTTPATYDDLMAWHDEQLGEPVAWFIYDGVGHYVGNYKTSDLDIPLYAKKG